MKKQYTAPTTEFNLVSVQDVLLSSGGLTELYSATKDPFKGDLDSWEINTQQN